MKTSVEQSTAHEMKALEPLEMQAVYGGFAALPDIMGMPDRTIQCGTMWLHDRLLERLGIPR